MINYDNKKVFSLGKHLLAVIILHSLNKNAVGQKHSIKSAYLYTVDVALRSSILWLLNKPAQNNLHV